jgi:hypothetical protein
MGTELRNDEALVPPKASSIFTIYCHIHMESGRRYIGLTSNKWERRWSQHLSKAKAAKSKRTKYHNHFYNALSAYGPDAFSHEVLQVCHSLEEANAAEQHWINLYDTTNILRGFNIARGGSHTPHPIKNPWDRPDYREKHLPHILKLNAAQTSSIRSSNAKKLWQNPKYRESVITASQSITSTPEYREAMSAKVKDLWKDPEISTKYREALVKNSQDPVLREKASRRWDDPEYRARCSAGVMKRSEAKRTATYCSRGHLRHVNDSTPSGHARECRTCINTRQKIIRSHCPKGHQYSDENVQFSSNGRRICKSCIELNSAPRPCSKCGNPKTRRSGPRFRCGPCTDVRIALWSANR